MWYKVKKIYQWTNQVRPTGWTPGSNTLVYLPLDWDANDSSWNWNNGTVSSNSWSYSWQYISWSSWRKCFYSSLWATTSELAWWVVSWTYASSAIRSNPRTVSIWFKSTGQTAQWSWQWIWNRSWSTQWEWFWLFSSISWNKFWILRYYSDPYITKSSWDSNWHNYIITYDNTNKSKLYIDWVLQTFAGNGTVTFDTLGTAYQLWILRVSGTSTSTNIYFSEYIIENKVRTATEVLNYFNTFKWDYWIS